MHYTKRNKMTSKILRHRISNLSIELMKTETRRSQMMGGSLESESLDRRIVDLHEMIGKLQDEEFNARWNESLNQ